MNCAGPENLRLNFNPNNLIILCIFRSYTYKKNHEIFCFEKIKAKKNI